MTDPNGNRAEVVFDALGLVVGSAIMGKVTESVGDSLDGFHADLTQHEIDDFYADPRGPSALALLGKATTRVIYEINKFFSGSSPTDKIPTYSAIVSHETHISDLRVGSPGSDLQVALSYSDGFARVIQAKKQAGPGPLKYGGKPVSRRWICSGWTVFNNRCLPFKKYEPFFADTHLFKFDARIGVSPIIL
jgi:hypothetical protein